jgi:hypothetical protein
MRQHWRAGGATVAAALIGLGTLAGCSNSPDSANTNNTTSSIRATTSTTSDATSTTTSSAADVLSAYRAGWAAFEHALADANPGDPELPATMVDPELQQVKTNLLADQLHGTVGRGTTTLHPKVAALSATSATVIDWGAALLE